MVAAGNASPEFGVRYSVQGWVNPDGPCFERSFDNWRRLYTQTSFLDITSAKEFESCLERTQFTADVIDALTDQIYVKDNEVGSSPAIKRSNTFGCIQSGGDPGKTDSISYPRDSGKTLLYRRARNFKSEYRFSITNSSRSPIVRHTGSGACRRRYPLRDGRAPSMGSWGSA